MKKTINKFDCCDIAISIVSHDHGSLIFQALETLSASLGLIGQAVRVCITLNLPESELVAALHQRSWPFNLQLIHNAKPLGFGANHNRAFAHSQRLGGEQWFVVMNPDIFWPKNTGEFWIFLVKNQWLPEIGLLCPKQVDTCGAVQDFARQLITPWGLLARIVHRVINIQPSGVAPSVELADWVNGACMVWRSKAFADLGGFDERYFMYCEDTDICLRMHLAGWHAHGVDVEVIHDARRNTGRSWQHLRWHLQSLWRLWTSRTFWRYHRLHR